MGKDVWGLCVHSAVCVWVCSVVDYTEIKLGYFFPSNGNNKYCGIELTLIPAES
jgi:hypothetical protein